jgi:arsenite/tail-anchored protein-transporting ATPase
MESLLGDLDLRFVFVGGKGGVGKTTTSASLASALSQRPECNRILLISTDPAHSLSDVFQQTFVPGTPTAVTGLAGKENAGNYSHRLEVLEVDPTESLEEEIAEWTKLMEKAEIADAGASMGEFQDWLRQIPGIDEATAISNVIHFIEEDRYDVVVFDTAPTGHTLKLLQLPKVREYKY